MSTPFPTTATIGYDPAWGTPTADGSPVPPPPEPGTFGICNHRAEQALDVTCVLLRDHTGKHRDIEGRWWADANTVDATNRYLIPREEGITYTVGRFPAPGQVFGFWHNGTWQSVTVGMTVQAMPGGEVRFIYPVPDGIEERFNSGAALLSRLLFQARERIDMQADSVELQTGKRDRHGRKLIEEIDTYRRGQGWPMDGFGGEE